MPPLEINSLYTASALQAEVDYCKRNATYRVRIDELEKKIDELAKQRNARDAKIRQGVFGAEERGWVEEMEGRIGGLEVQIRRADNELRMLGEALVGEPVVSSTVLSQW